MAQGKIKTEMTGTGGVPARCREEREQEGSPSQRQEGGRGPVMDVGQWYAAKDKKAKRLAAELKEAEANNAPAKDIRRLERELEQVRYVGD